MPGREQLFESKDSGGIYTRLPTHTWIVVGWKTEKKYYFQLQEILEQESKIGFQIKFAKFI